MAAPACNAGPYLVFFDWNETAIRPSAAALLDTVVATLGDCPGRRMMVTGYADSSGTARNNQRISQHRAVEVEAYLASRGVATSSIATAALGESQPRVPTADGVREVQNRRVEIVFEPADPAIDAGNRDSSVRP